MKEKQALEKIVRCLIKGLDSEDHTSMEREILKVALTALDRENDIPKYSTPPYEVLHGDD